MVYFILQRDDLCCFERKMTSISGCTLVYYVEFKSENHIFINTRNVAQSKN